MGGTAMNETKHTPGPWNSEPCPDMREMLIIDSERWVVGRVRRILSDITIAEAEANARLMAAAPDLLDALESILAVTNLRGSDSPLEAKTLAAIAKATGK